MSTNGTNATAPPPIDPLSLLPPYLDLPPHLSAHKYFFVCTLTVAAWDTLVLSPRTWKLFKSKEWPPLKLAFYFLRILMPIEFIIVGMSSSTVFWPNSLIFAIFSRGLFRHALDDRDVPEVLPLRTYHDRNPRLCLLRRPPHPRPRDLRQVSTGHTLAWRSTSCTSLYDGGCMRILPW